MRTPESKSAPLEVDRESLLELARGANLYDDRFAFMRELLSNAVDATLLRLFVERGASAFPTNERSMHDLRAALSAYPIDLRIERVAERRYRISVADRGIGIASTDIEHLQRIGSSRKNPARAALIDAMPEWMRPTGTFGIGVQSAFLVTDELVLRSRHVHDAPIDVTLLASDGGSVAVSAGEREEVGTTAELVATIERERGPFIEYRPYEYEHDVLLDSEVDQALHDATVLVEALAESLLVPLRLNDRELPRRTHDAAVFDPRTLVEITLPTTDDEAEDPTDPEGQEAYRKASMRRGGGLPMPTGRVRGAYRGSPIQQHTEPHQIRWSYDVHCGSARELLHLSRDHLTSTGQQVVEERVSDALRVIGAAHLTQLRRDRAAPRTQVWLSLHLHQEGIDPGDEWKTLAVARRPDGSTVTLGDIIAIGEATIDMATAPAKPQIVLPTGESFALRQRSRYLYVALPDRIVEWGRELLRIGQPRAVVSESTVRELLRRLGAPTDDTRPIPRRPFLHVSESFAQLSAMHPYERERPPREHTPFRWPRSMLSPWTFRDGVVDLPQPLRWIEWTTSQAPDRDPAAVACLLVRFLREYEPELRANANFRVSHDLDAVISEIRGRYPDA
jgi:hypothetical protein